MKSNFKVAVIFISIMCIIYFGFKKYIDYKEKKSTKELESIRNDSQKYYDWISKQNEWTKYKLNEDLCEAQLEYNLTCNKITKEKYLISLDSISKKHAEEYEKFITDSINYLRFK